MPPIEPDEVIEAPVVIPEEEIAQLRSELDQALVKSNEYLPDGSGKGPNLLIIRNELNENNRKEVRMHSGMPSGATWISQTTWRER